MLILWILLSIVIALGVWLVFWSIVSFLVNKGKYHQQFINGNPPQTAPDGFYQGTAHILFNLQTPWLGKSFDSPNNLGFNIFTPFGAKLLKVLAPFYQKFRKDEANNTEALNKSTRRARCSLDSRQGCLRYIFLPNQNNSSKLCKCRSRFALLHKIP